MSGSYAAMRGLVVMFKFLSEHYICVYFMYFHMKEIFSPAQGFVSLHLNYMLQKIIFYDVSRRFLYEINRFGDQF